MPVLYRNMPVLVSMLQFQAWQVTPQNQTWRAATVSARSCYYKYAYYKYACLVYFDEIGEYDCNLTLS